MTTVVFPLPTRRKLLYVHKTISGCPWRSNCVLMTGKACLHSFLQKSQTIVFGTVSRHSFVDYPRRFLVILFTTNLEFSSTITLFTFTYCDALPTVRYCTQSHTWIVSFPTTNHVIIKQHLWKWIVASSGVIRTEQ